MAKGGDYSDCIVVGAGIAGLCAALGASERGLQVSLLLKAEDCRDTNSWFAQGGIVGLAEEDSPELLAKDILDAGVHMNFSSAVDLLSREGPLLVNELLVKRAGIQFSKNESGKLDLTKEGAHDVRRIYHYKDLSGQAIMQGLMALVEKNPRITVRPSMEVVDIITNGHHSTLPEERYRPTKAIGVYVFNKIGKEVQSLFAPSIILATGGIGQVYKHTSNPLSATGDGVAMASRAGATIINGEFVQFHPTTLYHRDERNFLITESLRGEGAFLVNRGGQPFMEKYHPQLKDLAPRDEVSRAIYKEMDATGTACVYLNATEIDHLDLKERFPGIFKTCMNLNIDIRRDMIPVVPAAHYFCGGVKVDVNGETDVQGLFAVGETACTGVHGANRLASVSLLEGLYFGYHTGLNLAEKPDHPLQELIDSIPPWKSPKEQVDVDPLLIHSDRETIQNIMWNYTGIIRNKRRLKRALADLHYLSHRLESFYRQAPISTELLELRNSLLTGFLITQAASTNPQSKGCHYLEE